MIGIDLGKSLFQVHAVDASGRVIARRRLRRSEVMSFLSAYPSTIVAMVPCATAHYLAQEIGSLGHEVRWIAPQYARAYVKTNKNDAADAEAICEAALRPTMRFSDADKRWILQEAARPERELRTWRAGMASINAFYVDGSRN